MPTLYALILALALAYAPQDPTPCHTDSECMALCPANDPACDGGPQD
jgi:hypothetical protein